MSDEIKPYVYDPETEPVELPPDEPDWDPAPIVHRDQPEPQPRSVPGMLWEVRGSYKHADPDRHWRPNAVCFVLASTVEKAVARFKQHVESVESATDIVIHQAILRSSVNIRLLVAD